MTLAALLVLMACNEALPPRIVPEDALVIDRVIINQATGPGGIFISIALDIRNFYEETFAGPVDVGGNIRIWWQRDPEVEVNLAISDQADLLLDPGEGYAINSAWLLQTDDGRNVFDLLDFNKNDIRDGIRYAAPEVFLLEVQVTLFKEVGLLESGPHEFVLQGWQAVGLGD